MSLAGRLFMDVSYTRTQHGNVGITRTVRRLLDELETIAGCKPVVFHRTGFRLLRPAQRSPTASGVTAVDNAAGRMFRWLNSASVRKLVSLIPKAVLHRAWRLNNDLTFDSLSKDEEPLTFRGGDCLVLADQSWNYRVWLAAQQARAQGANVVLVLYDLIPLRHPEFCPPLFTDVFRLWLVRMLGCCDMVMCISAATEADLLTWCTEEKLPLPRTRHFRLGCDLPKENAGDIRDSIARFMRSSVPVFAAVGTIEPRKNYSMLLRTFERLWLEGVNAHLLIAGRATGEETDFVERLRMHPEQGRKLLTLFDASDQELAHVYVHARALVLPSLAEGFGLPLVEARSRGCAVIANDLASFSELADEGVFFYRDNSDYELAFLVAQHARQENVPTYKPMSPFTWRDSAAALLEVLNRT
jgi:glycosyltransferase involved in cell wall biosynthesis